MQGLSTMLRYTSPAAAVLLLQWWNLMWYILLGVPTALDTLGSQAVGEQGGWSICADGLREPSHCTTDQQHQ